VGTERVVCQTLEEVVSTKELKPNTNSFGQPDYILPFDLIWLAKSDKIVVHYYLMKDNLKEFYDRELMPGYEYFICDSIEQLVERFPSPREAWQKVNDFRREHGENPLDDDKFRLCTYNEAIFTRPIKIIPEALFGYRKETGELAKKLGIPYVKTASHFYEKLDTP
jgi:hypothetical protein